MSRKTWVVLVGGLLGIVAMRLVIGQLLSIVRRYPTLVDAAFIIIAWVGIKLFVEYLHAAGQIDLEVNKWLSFGLIAVIFTVAYLVARRKGPVEDDEATAEEAEELLK
jgi:predicted tellurium resistance membrane protein TerC